MEKNDKFIERRIITGMIVSTRYLQSIREYWNPKFIESKVAKMLASWCLEYFEKYDKAPRQDIESIYTKKLKSGAIKSEMSDGIETLLQGLSSEYKRRKFNRAYLVDETLKYFQERRLVEHAENIQAEIQRGSLVDAERVASSYSPTIVDKKSAINPFEDSDRVEKAFKDQKRSLIRLPGAFGEFINSQLTRDAFVAFMGPEKVGKTWFLIELAGQALESGCNVAFFQAGDMSEGQMIRRLYIWLAQRSDRKRYCGELYIPVVDCKLSQLGICKRDERENKRGIFPKDFRLEKITYDILLEAYLQNRKKYRPCTNCKFGQGAVWFKRRPPVEPLTWKEGYKEARKFTTENPQKLKLATYANETLTTGEMSSQLDVWEKQEGFVPDVTLVDYFDILAPDPDLKKLDTRNQQNKIWQRGRRLSQERHNLLITVTQAAASSYDRDTLRLKDFSETKTKYAHVTAMYGLNQTDEEKRIGIMRINDLVVREDDFNRTNQIHILQRIQAGQPLVGSYR